MNEEKSFPKTSINWYPGHMVKTKREIKEKLNLIDIVYEVIDARIPKSSRIIDIDELINNKKRIIIMTKYDLCDKKKTDKYVKEYEKKYPVVCLDLKNINQKDINKLIELTNNLLEEINIKRKNIGLKPRLYRALIVGQPNVGKSTLINRISKKNKLQTGNKPGITKNLTWIKVGETIELLDTPGILYPKISNYDISLNLASFNIIKEEILDKEEVASYIIKYLYYNYQTILASRYNISLKDEFNLDDIFNQIANSTKSYKKGNIIDIDKVYLIIINDIKYGNIKNITFDNYI